MQTTERHELEARELEKQHKEREKERLEREKIEREKQMERERERLEREQERERLEKQRATEQAVHKHFEESLRLAQQKRTMCWNLINSLPPPRATGPEDDRKRADHDAAAAHQQRLLVSERLRQESRERQSYYPPGVQRQPAVNKGEYPPPAHSRVTGVKSEKVSSGHTSLPKAEPNINLFSYPSYQPQGFLAHDSSKVKSEQIKSSSGLSTLMGGKSVSASMGLDRDREMLPNPPPLMSDLKNSVIVKNEGKSPHHHDSSKVPPSHSPSPKLRVGDMISSQSSHYLPATTLSQHKSGAVYEYRSPSQSPHHLAARHTPSPHHSISMEPQNLANVGKVHARPSSQQSSPHGHPHRQSPHAMQQQQPPPHPSPPDQRYSGNATSGSLAYGKAATVSSYPYPAPTGLVTTAPHYAGGSVTAGPKPKVSSPAPPHIYGQPERLAKGITTGTPVCRAQDSSVNACPLPLTSKAPLTSSVSPSPYQQMSHHHPTPQQASTGPPPPAHSRTSVVGDHRGMYDLRVYPGAGIVGGPASKSQHQGSSPPSASAAPLPTSRTSPLTLPMHHHPAVHHTNLSAVYQPQTQPLDLGVSSDRSGGRDEMPGSPKRKGVPMHHSPGGMSSMDASKKRRNEPNVSQTQSSQQNVQTVSQPLLARVSEPSPLIASAATTITTVVNTAAYCTPAMTMMVPVPHETTTATTTVTTSPHPIPARTGSADSSRPSSAGSVSGSALLFPLGNNGTPQHSPAPLAPPVTCSSPGLIIQQNNNVSNTPVKPPPSSADSEKSNSPGPVRPTASSYPVHKLKKAWLQRHSGEDGISTVGVVGSGTCVTLPLTLSNSGNGNSSGGSKDSVNSGSTNSLSSLQNIGSMAVSSIPKGKQGCVANKPNNRKGASGKETGVLVTINGHASDSKLTLDDSTSSDPEREIKSPPKRKPKLKRKKNARKVLVEELKKKKGPAAAVASESGSESEKESCSEKDSDSGASTNQSTLCKKSTNGSGGNSGTSSGASGKEPRKRGRRPKTSKNDRGEEPRQKKSRDDPPAPQRNPFRKPPTSQLKKTGESFLQDGPCHEVASKLAKCRECRWTPHQRSRNQPNIFCRFYAFRRLRYTKNGQLAIAGFSDPHKDATEEHLKLWLPRPDSPPADLDVQMSRFLLSQVGDQFCDLLRQEEESVSIHMSEVKTIAWKQAVRGVREMCDVCETTLFNFHWVCGKCGFAVCIDCYKGRKNGTIRIWGEPGKDRDDFSWLLCTNRQAHEQEKLMLTQIIVSDSLMKLARRVHEIRALCGVPQHCACPMSKEVSQLKPTNGICKDFLKSLVKSEPLNGILKVEKKKEGDSLDKDKMGAANGAVIKQEDKNSPLSWLADVALSNEDKKECDESGCSSDSDEDKDGNYSTLRELLIRPSHKPNGNGSRSASPSTNNSTNSSGNVNNPVKIPKKARLEALKAVISSVIEGSNITDQHDEEDDKPEVELKHFVRRYHRTQKGRDPLPIRIMTLTESKSIYPDVAHSWLCDGKLLRLLDPNYAGNYRIFQDQWKRGQPVIVSDVSRNLDMDLWHPESFSRDFGEVKNDLVNCTNGNLVPKQPMRKFWEGFDNYSKRLKDERGNPMLLKLKDWPAGEDFAEMTPSRFADLMRALPLSEYTNRTGRLNLASRLPEYFVRPDLGPKMYNAYGSALYPSKGTTNLHLDISDAVNVMVYVGIPKDCDNDEHIKEAFRAIDEAGCDILTRRRVREKGEFPGALWHIYSARDADKIRDMLNKVAIERGARLEPHHDPIHDQSWYLDGPLRERLYAEYAVEGYSIVQCLGDAVFIPAGAPHQVRNLHNCIKVAEDFVSPENISHCFHLTQEFRDLSDTHSNHEDKLQIKNIIYHTVKDAISVLSKLAFHAEDEPSGPSAGTDVGGGNPSESSSNGNNEDSNGGSNSSPNTEETEVKKEPVT